MNPLIWKREHQLALAIAAGVGSIAGLVFAYLQPDSDQSRHLFLYYYSWDVNWRYVGAILVVPGWALLGAILGAAVVDTRQLMR